MSSWVQVERKFVMLMLGTPGVLAAMDPHAADERVRLEQLQVRSSGVKLPDGSMCSYVKHVTMWQSCSEALQHCVAMGARCV